jgi:hypothetical protein
VAPSHFFARSRRPDIPIKTAPPAAQDDRSRMNVRPWFGSAGLACATHSFRKKSDAATEKSEDQLSREF